MPSSYNRNMADGLDPESDVCASNGGSGRRPQEQHGLENHGLEKHRPVRSNRRFESTSCDESCDEPLQELGSDVSSDSSAPESQNSTKTYKHSSGESAQELANYDAEKRIGPKANYDDSEQTVNFETGRNDERTPIDERIRPPSSTYEGAIGNLASPDDSEKTVIRERHSGSGSSVVSMAKGAGTGKDAPTGHSSHGSEEQQDLTEVATQHFPSQPSDLEKTRTATRSDSVGSQSQPRSVFRLGWHAAAESLIGMELDHFRIESLVGIGGMGAVFRGEDTRLNREVAIKAIPLAGRDPESMRRFRFEAQSAAKLDHPNIARVYYVGETADWSYIVFEFVEGVNLREIIMRQGPMSLEQSVYLIRQVSQALQHASERQVVHRDIKPSNIVLTSSGQAKIVDMGLARVIEMDRSTNDLTASGVTLGTFDYISPEQAHDPRDADVRSDIYSLGCTWYYLLTGYPPFPDGTALQKLLLHGTKMPEDPRQFRSDLSDSVIAILRKMIAKKPSDRYQQPLDLIDDLQTLAVLEDLAWTRDTDPREGSSPVSTSYWRRVMPYAISLATIGMVTGVLYTQGRRTDNFLIPNVLFPEPPADQNRLGSAPKGLDSENVLSVPGEANSVLVDSRFSSEQLETNRQLASSLDQAIERINLTSDANRIVLQSPVFRSTGNLRAINRTEGSLTIESQAGSRCRIEIQISDDYLSDSRAWLDCGTNAITLVGCDLVWKTINPRQSLFALRNLSQLRLQDCTISIEPATSSSSASPLPAVIRSEALVGNIANSAPQSTVASTVQLSLDRVAIIGQADILQINPPVRTECRIANSVFAVTGSLLHLPRVNGSILGNSRVVLDMRSVTTWASRAFINASWVAGDTPPIPVTRFAKQCVFSGMESLVYWDVAINEDWKFWDQTRRGEALTQWLDFRGEDNSYDEEITKQLVEAKLRNGMAESVALTAEALLLAAERGIELTIPWKAKPTSDAATRLPINLAQFELQKSSFPRGADIVNLMTLQSSSSGNSSAGGLSPATVPAATQDPASESTGGQTSAGRPSVPVQSTLNLPAVATPIVGPNAGTSSLNSPLNPTQISAQISTGTSSLPTAGPNTPGPSNFGPMPGSGATGMPLDSTILPMPSR